jgi:hypothetical protein
VNTLRVVALQWAIQKAQAERDLLELRLEFSGDEGQPALVQQLRGLEAIIKALRDQLDDVASEQGRSEPP